MRYSLNSGEYTVTGRRTPPEFVQAIVQGLDTLCKFSLIYSRVENDKHERYWDGSDSSSILPLPDAWDKTSKGVAVTIRGTLFGDSIVMKTTTASAVKEFYINNEPVVFLYGRDYPSRAVFLKHITTAQLRIFTMLSTNNYEYFNFSFE